MRHSPLIQAILPIRSVVVTLRWLYNSQPGVMHHAALHAWVRYLSGSAEGFSHQVIVEPLENGHIAYQKGDCYRFRLTFLKGSDALIHTLLQALQHLPDSVPEPSRQAGPFGDNLILEKLEDNFEHHSITSIEQLSLYDANALSLETALWSSNPLFKIAFTTPVRLLRPKSERGENLASHQRYCRDKADLTWSLFSQRLMDTLIHLFQQHFQQGSHERLQRLDWPEATLHSSLAFWLNQGYRNQASSNHSKQARSKHSDAKQSSKVKDLSGMMVQMQLEIPPDFPAELLALIVLGQYTGIGQSRAFGLGMYQLQDAYGMTSHPRPKAAQSLLERCMSDSALRHACHEMYPRRADFEPSDTDEEHQIGVDSQMSALYKSQQAILNGHYQAGPLQPVEIDKPDGGTRMLAVPSWHERTLQKAVTELLGNTLDKLWMQHSYGYRKGHSRLNARDQINQYVKQGYNWVLESDIESFFDSVNWLNLEQRLKLLFPNEPLVSLLMQWVSADKQLNDGSRQARYCGLPQGAPISPILANLLLDDLDQDMIAKGYQIIRYADDFVMLFKSKEQAVAALEDIKISLAEHSLAINLDKTRIVEASQGFQYLGYVFIDGYAIESKREKTPVKATVDHTSIEASSEPKAIDKIGERDSLGTLLTIAGDVAMLSTEKHRLVVEQYDEQHSYPWASLSSVLLIGPHHITTPALKAAFKAEVAIHFCNNFGQYQGVSAATSPSEFGSDFWLQQSQHLQSETNALTISQALVSSRIAGIKSVIKRRDNKAPELNTINRILRQLDRAQDLDQLRGYEGQASKQLWAFFRRYLDSDWEFTGRNRRPPKDPVNAMLSLGYSFIYGVADSLNRVVGLYPWQGALHQKHGNHYTLASDLMEPFRYLVERVVLTLINKGQIKPDDFSQTDQGCQMSSEARKTLLHGLLVQLTQTSSYQQSFLNEMRDQAYRLAVSCKTQQSFVPWSPKK